MRVLIVGGNGFIGSHLKDAFLSNGLEVSVLDRQVERYRPPLENVRVVLGDLADPVLAQRSLNNTEAVIYCASTTTPQTSADEPVNDITENLIPFLRFLNLARHQRVRRFIFLSSGGTVYGVANTLPVSEEHPTNPFVSHGIVKLAMEKYLLTLARTGDMEVVILRVGNAYGERQNPFGGFGAIATFLGCVAMQQNIVLWGDGSIVRDYIYAKDVSAACLTAVMLEDAKGVYNIGTARGYSLNDVLEVITDTTGQPMPEVHREAKRNFDVPAIVLDNKLARQELHWKPATSLVEGVRLTWNWVCKLPRPKNSC